MGFNLPIASVHRTIYGEYPEYHTSEDNKSLMDFAAMTRTLDVYEDIARTIESSQKVRNTIVYGEPQFSRRGDLYSTFGARMPGGPALALKWLIHYADGERDLLELAEMSGLDPELLLDVAERAIEFGIFERVR